MKNYNFEFEEEDRSLAFHPYNVLLTLLLGGICALFLAFSGAYVYTLVQQDVPPIALPLLFLFNTAILLLSSASMNWAKKSYLMDHTKNYQKALLYTIILSLIFLAAQFIAWNMLFQQKIFFAHSTLASYVYVISGLHFAHVIAGLPFLAVFLYVARTKMKEPVSVLVYFSDPEKRLKLNLLTKYWHFLDLLWIYLIVFFYVNYFIFG